MDRSREGEIVREKFDEVHKQVGEMRKHKAASSDYDDEKRENDDEKEDAEEERPTAGEDDDKKELFVGNLAFGTTEHSIRGALGKFGKITNIKLPKGRDGRPKGFAFVEFATQSDAQKACDGMNGQELEGRGLRINFSVGLQNSRGNEGGRYPSAGGPASGVSGDSDTIFVGNIGF